MGAAVGRALRDNGVEVIWASAGRGDATAERAAAAGLEDVGDVEAILRRADVVVSVVPPHAARDVAATVDGFGGIYVDANAVSPDTAHAIGASVSRFVDGGIVGPPPREPGTTRRRAAPLCCWQASQPQKRTGSGTRFSPSGGRRSRRPRAGWAPLPAAR
jgi:hypothetical protein